MTKLDAKQTSKLTGERIRIARKNLKLSASTLAREIGVQTPQLYKYEKGLLPIDYFKILKLAQCLKVPLSYFAYFDEENTIDEQIWGELKLYLSKVKNQQMQKAIVNLCKDASEIQVLTLS